jgi:hypothetical protein
MKAKFKSSNERTERPGNTAKIIETIIPTQQFIAMSSNPFTAFDQGNQHISTYTA